MKRVFDFRTVYNATKYDFNKEVFDHLLRLDAHLDKIRNGVEKADEKTEESGAEDWSQVMIPSFALRSNAVGLVPQILGTKFVILDVREREEIDCGSSLLLCSYSQIDLKICKSQYLGCEFTVKRMSPLSDGGIVGCVRLFRLDIDGYSRMKLKEIYCIIPDVYFMNKRMDLTEYLEVSSRIEQSRMIVPRDNGIVYSVKSGVEVEIDLSEAMKSCDWKDIVVEFDGQRISANDSEYKDKLKDLVDKVFPKVLEHEIKCCIMDA